MSFPKVFTQIFFLLFFYGWMDEYLKKEKGVTVHKNVSVWGEQTIVCLPS